MFRKIIDQGRLRALYERDQIGVMIVPDFLTDEGRKGLLREVTSRLSPYGMANDAHPRQYPCGCEFTERYGEYVDSMGIHLEISHNRSRVYRPGQNLASHQDHLYSVLVTSLVLQGNGKIRVGSDMTVDLDAPAGSAILLRAPRTADENDETFRPWHSILPVPELRYATVFRQRNPLDWD